MDPSRSLHRFPLKRTPLPHGFTLIELMVAMAVAAILAAVALPSYTQYVQRSRVPPALDGLSALAVRMEQGFQDAGQYTCPNPLPTVANFTLDCAVSTIAGRAAAGFTANAVGTGPMLNYQYRINYQGVRTTVSHPKGVPAQVCWTTRGSTCDT